MADHSTSSLKVEPTVAPVRRIITGHNAKGQAIIVSDETCPHIAPIMGLDNFASTELWVTSVPGDNAKVWRLGQIATASGTTRWKCGLSHRRISARQGFSGHDR